MQVFTIMQWKKVHSDGFVCKVSEMFVSKLHGGILKILRADLWENFKKVVSYKQQPSREARAAKLELSNFLSTTVKENKDFFVKFDKETDRVDTFIWQFFLGTTNLSYCERCSKFL